MQRLIHKIKHRYITQSLFSNTQAGMTFIELIVVLSIFAVTTSIVLANYGEFQAKVEFKNLASKIALKVVEAQKSSLAGRLPPAGYTIPSSTWKPSYGIFTNKQSDNTSFIYFADLNQNGDYPNTSCNPSSECIEKIILPAGYTISALDVFYQDSSTSNINKLAIVFARPDSRANLKSTPPIGAPPPAISYVQITLTSPRGTTATIKIYPSGRVQLN
jgi:prepilin-type N-terminal cleavage/methylation domain-containing protein